VPQSLRTLLFDALFVVLVVVSVYRLVRWLLARRLTPQRAERREERRKAIAALCEQRGMVPNPVDLSMIFPRLIPGRSPVYENSFAAPDGSLWAADLWTPSGKEQWYAFSMLGFVVQGVNLPYIEVTRKGQAIPPGLARGAPLTLESIDLDERFTIRAVDRRSAVMLLDQGMMQWLLDCEQVSFEIMGDRGQAVVRRSSEPTYQPGLVPGWHRPGHSDAPISNPSRADPVELELLFKFVDGFGPRVPELMRTEFAVAHPT
jgi:hypothetical protein